MGGLGVWSLLQTHPEKWAAAVVLAAYDNFTAPMSISRIPLRVFQGDADRSVPADLVPEMMKQLKKLNANLRYTEYHNVDHDVWNRGLLSQSRCRRCRRGGAGNRQKAKLALARLPRIIKIVA
jgi:predicted peptidase